MATDPGNQITQYLLDWRSGDEQALTRLTNAVYSRLHRLAAVIMNSGNRCKVIQPTELVHEFFIRLPGLQEVDFESRGHFFNLSARIMRNILVDHARKRLAARRRNPVTLRFDSKVADQALDIDVLLINEILERFAVSFPRQAKVVELRFFGGLTADEAAQALTAAGTETSLRSVERDWKFAKAWLHDAITAN